MTDGDECRMPTCSESLLVIVQDILVGSVRTAVRSATSTSKRMLEMLQ